MRVSRFPAPTALAVDAQRPAPLALGPVLAALWVAFALATLVGRAVAG